MTGEALTTAISSSVTTAANGSNFLTNEIDRRIAKIRPMATPIDQLSRQGDVRHVGSMKVNFYTADVKASSSPMSRDMDRADYTKNGAGEHDTIALAVTDSAIFSVTETIMVPDVNINGSPLTVYVTEIESNMVKGQVVNEVSTYTTEVVPFVKEGTEVVRMGRAAGELDVQTPQYETLPKRGENYCQIFKMQVEESTLHRLSNKEAQWGFSDQEEVAIIDMRQGMEKNFLFGTKTRLEAASVSGDDIYLTGGVWNQPGLDTFNYTKGALTEATLISLCRNSFTGGKGSARKILMGGSDFIEALSQLDCRRIVAGRDSMVRWGLEFREIRCIRAKSMV